MIAAALLAAMLGGGSPPAQPPPKGETRGAWEQVKEGLELGSFRARPGASQPGAKITILRVDMAKWEPVLLSISESREPAGRSARQWAARHGLVAATNAGMFATDHRTHVGYMRSGDHVNSSRIAGTYHSVAAFGPRREGLPAFRIFDLDSGTATMESIQSDYGSVVQNLRLIKRPGQNRWTRQEKRWSEAALGEDGEGRMLLIFCRAPFSMHELNEELLALGIGLVAAQHLEGGPEAQLFVDAGGSKVELIGSHETSFHESDDNTLAWPVPNVLGVRPRKPAD